MTGAVGEAGSAPSPRQTIYSVQVLRGLAALAVVIYHAHIILAQPEYGAVDVFGAVASRGWIGVNMFFVLSGFIIMFAHHRDIGRPERVGRYVWRRFVRVYPIYWIFTLAYVLAGLAGMGFPEFRWTIGNVVSSATLLMVDPAPAPPLKVAWTLFYEVMFYIAFIGLILNRKAGTALFGVWVIAILIYGFALDRSAMGPMHMWSIYFMCGIGAYFVFRSAPRALAPVLIAGGVATVAVCAVRGLIPAHIIFVTTEPGDLLALAVAFALLLSGVTLLERGAHWRVPAPLLLLGDASYSVYLVHSAALSLVAALTHHLIPSVLPPELLFALATLTALLAGVVAHLLVEKPLLGWMRMRAGRPTNRPQAVLR